MRVYFDTSQFWRGKKAKNDKEVKEIPTKGLYKIIIKVFFLALNENSLKRALNYSMSIASYLTWFIFKHDSSHIGTCH